MIPVSEQAEHHRRHQKARLGRAVALDDLQVQRHERDRAEEGEPDHEADGAGRSERRVAEELERQDRLGGARLDQREQREQCGAADDRGEHPRSAPRVARAAEARVEDHAGQARGEDDRAEPVDPMPLCHLLRLEGGRDHRQRSRAERQVDVEDPPPREVVDEEAAEQRPYDDGRAEHAAEQALVAAAVARRYEVADDRHRHDDQAAAAEPLHGAEGDQLRHGLRRPAESGAGQEDHERDLQDAFAAVDVAELAVQRADHGRGEQVGGHDPGEVLQPAQVADDRRQRRRHDRLVERRDEEHEEQRAEDQPPPRRSQLSHRAHLAGRTRQAPGGRIPAGR